MMEGLHEISLYTLVIMLEVLCQTNVDIENLKQNGFDLTNDVIAQ